jgi:hypothetical protein
MTYKSAYTPEEVALIASGSQQHFDGIKRLHEYQTLEEVKRQVDEIEEEYEKVSSADIAEIYGGMDRFERRRDSAYKLVAKYQNAMDILDGINRAIAIGQIDVHVSGELQVIDQKSIAAWFMDQGDVENAQHFYPNILTVWRPAISRPPKATKPEGEDVSTKTKNAYLKTINALAMTLISGSSGKPHSDAEAVLSLLDQAGIKHPVCKKKLADYLKEAGEY